MSANSRPGEAHGAAKLTEREVRGARTLARRGWPLEDINRELRILRKPYGLPALQIAKSTLSMAITGATWGHVPGALRAKTARQAARRPRRRTS